MILTQNGVDEPVKFVGQGYLRQEVDGTIHYRLYPTTVTGVDPMAGHTPLGVAGMLIEPHRFYRLETRAQDGLRWQVERTIPEIDRSYLDTGLHYLVGGDARQISFRRRVYIQPSRLTKFYLTMIFFAETKIPCNTRTKTTSVIGNEQSQMSSRLDVSLVSTEFGEFTISKKPGMVIVEVVAENPFSANIETRIVEALGLVLATPLDWNVISRVENDIETVHVRGKPHVVNAQLLPPVGPCRDVDLNGDVWRLFARYLSLVCTHTGDSFHPCSRHLFAVLKASAGGIMASGLALSVAVEGIVKELFPHAGPPMEGMGEIVQRLQEYCLAWKDIPGGELGKSLKQRLPGMIGQLNNISTKDRLYAVAKEKVTSETLIKAWNELRHKLAHGVTPGSRSNQKLVDMCNNVTQLMYHLIFRGAGYEGTYEDYSSRGFPTKRYRGRSLAQEEIAIAAYFIRENENCKRGYVEHGHDVEDWFAAKEQLEQGLL
ncbi:MAG: DUF2934 domain-containing protein [Planctomycetaceae bacterium]|nr:DUF2934 domain-containing protein [Planctomycetaceae bacterium]MBV8557139.1 DUF2934 domain-containing protein [Planctomycetaceae bacterium]